MGLLDDAIRDHLDLKRRRGGDPAEIERAEREALGPVRRPGEPEADEALGEPQQHAIDGEASADPGGAAAPGEAPHEEAAASEHEERIATEGEQPAEYDRDDVAVAPDALSAGPEYEPVDRDEAQGLISPGGQTIEYDVEEELSSHHVSEGSQSDVLEETPEFLQDTPDHDRLWFEHRPPRDFDFDG